jgi:hypothetical protein
MKLNEESMTLTFDTVQTNIDYDPSTIEKIEAIVLDAADRVYDVVNAFTNMNIDAFTKMNIKTVTVSAATAPPPEGTYYNTETGTFTNDVSSLPRSCIKKRRRNTVKRRCRAEVVGAKYKEHHGIDFALFMQAENASSFGLFQDNHNLYHALLIETANVICHALSEKRPFEAGIANCELTVQPKNVVGIKPISP